jgi:lipopolysaccharide export system protein LptA
MWVVSVVLVALPGWWIWPAAAQKARSSRGSPPAAAQDADLPLRITASSLEADQEKRLVLFRGEVKAQKGEAVLYCDQLLVYFQPPATAPAAPKVEPQPLPGGFGGGEKIDRIEARGRVRFVYEDRVATGETAVYYQDRGEIILTGNPKVWQGDNTLKGERIIFNTRENRVRVESSPSQRVEAFLYSQGGDAGGLLPAAPGRPPREARPAR